MRESNTLDFAKINFVLPIILLQFILMVALSLFMRDGGWDDGAITIAFSRTFALDGKIALNAASEQVEGFSSLSWFLLNAPFMWLHPSFRTMLLISQILTIVSLCLTTLVLDRLCRVFELTPLVRLAALLAFAFCGGGFAESINGMEMGLFALSACLITYGFLQGYKIISPLTVTAIALFISTRFEGVFYIAFLALPLLFNGRRRDFILTGLVASLAFLLIAAFRYFAFADILPNTVWAKMHVPYTKSGVEALRSHIEGATALLAIFAAPIAALVLGGKLFPTFKALRPSWKRLSYLVFPIIGAITFSLLIGANVGGGYSTRMQFFAFPHALVLMGFIIDRITAAQRSRTRLAAVASLFGVTLLASFPDFPFRYVSAVAADSIQVTPKRYRENGEIVDLVRQKGGLSTLTFLTPDVGGLGLCCEKIRVVDLGLLTNRALGKKGYAALPEVLETERPQLIEAHWQWASIPRLFDIPYFRANYRPAYIGRTRLFIEAAFAQSLIAKNEACAVPLTDEAALRRFLLMHRYKNDESTYDIFALVRSKSVIVLKALDKDGLCDSVAASAARPAGPF